MATLKTFSASCAANTSYFHLISFIKYLFKEKKTIEKKGKSTQLGIIALTSTAKVLDTVQVLDSVWSATNLQGDHLRMLKIRIYRVFGGNIWSTNGKKTKLLTIA